MKTTDGGAVEAVALIVQIHLEQNRLDLALKEVQAAKSWAQDSLLVNLAESWVGLRVVSTRPAMVGMGILTCYRAVRSISKLSTYSKNSHKRPRPRPHKVWFHKQLPKSILAD